MSYRRLASAALTVLGSGAATFYMEPLLPLGDWRWAVIAAVCFAAALWLIRGDQPTVAAQTLPSKDKGRKTLPRIPEEYLLLFAMAGFGLAIFMPSLIRIVNKLIDRLLPSP